MAYFTPGSLVYVSIDAMMQAEILQDSVAITGGVDRAEPQRLLAVVTEHSLTGYTVEPWTVRPGQSAALGIKESVVRQHFDGSPTWRTALSCRYASLVGSTVIIPLLDSRFNPIAQNAMFQVRLDGEIAVYDDRTGMFLGNTGIDGEYLQALPQTSADVIMVVPDGWEKSDGSFFKMLCMTAAIREFGLPAGLGMLLQAMHPIIMPKRISFHEGVESFDLVYGDEFRRVLATTSHTMLSVMAMNGVLCDLVA